jgi:hypothetical protein
MAEPATGGAAAQNVVEFESKTRSAPQAVDP